MTDNDEVAGHAPHPIDKAFRELYEFTQKVADGDLTGEAARIYAESLVVVLSGLHRNVVRCLAPFEFKRADEKSVVSK